jgi:hypothetical protein
LAAFDVVRFSMTEQPSTPVPTPTRRMPILPVVVMAVVVAGCSVYANWAYTVTRPADFENFPPFLRGVNANDNGHLGAEYYNVARSLAGGEGFANPFGRRTGPSAWMPPILSLIEAVVLCAGGSKDTVMMVVIFLQVYTLIGTGLLALALAHRTAPRFGAWAALPVFFLLLACHFHQAFQFTHDSFLVLLAMDLLVAGFVWGRPLAGRARAAGWGVFGGFCALVNPIVALAWGVLSLVLVWQQRAWRPLAFAVAAGALTLLPWTARNFLVFGRFIPVKSNVAYELYQSECMQPDGLISNRTFPRHPINAGAREAREYDTLGEMAFVDRKRQQFWEAVGADPLDFLDRVSSRVLGTTLWYVPFEREKEPRTRPWTFRMCQLAYPLPFLGLLVLLFPAGRSRLDPAQWIVMGTYVLYLLPYAAVSYYDRYAFPLLGVKTLLVVWGVGRLLALLLPRRRASAEPVVVVEAPAPVPVQTAVAAVR